MIRAGGGDRPAASSAGNRKRDPSRGRGEQGRPGPVAEPSSHQMTPPVPEAAQRQSSGEGAASLGMPPNHRAEEQPASNEDPGTGKQQASKQQAPCQAKDLKRPPFRPAGRSGIPELFFDAGFKARHRAYYRRVKALQWRAATRKTTVRHNVANAEDAKSFAPEKYQFSFRAETSAAQYLCDGRRVRKQHQSCESDLGSKLNVSFSGAVLCIILAALLAKILAYALR
ncbi:uncharacterized protein [Dermacentor albipictus]|uniref:uncharacterized protein n=1 Tax=Dermacentor albipictus TaxID=60249 RepID=UPI0038FCB7EF